jgi:hypothetical protein
MERKITTATLTGSLQRLSEIPDTAKYVLLQIRELSDYTAGFDSTGTNYVTLASGDLFEEIYVEGQIVPPIYVTGTLGHHVEIEYWI